MNKTTLILIFSFFTLFSIGTLAMVGYQPALEQRLKETYTSLLEEPKRIDSAKLVEPVHVEKEPIIELPVFSGKLNKDSYDDHLNAAELLGIGLILDEKQLFQLVANRVLVEVDFGDGYKVDPLTHSHPYLSLRSKKVLEELGRTFQALAGEGNYFTVSSATRTIEQQKKLKKRNRNAADGNSSHSYGVSFDISYIRFNGVKSYDRKAQKNLEAVLKHFQKENKIFVIKERRQACYHVTVR